MKKVSAPRSGPGKLGVLLSLTLLACSPALALDLNGFMPAKGQGTVALSYARDSYDEFWMGKTKVAMPPIGTVTNTSLSAWLQWGLSDRLALLLNAPRVSSDSDGTEGFSESGIQDLSLAAKYRLLAAKSDSRCHSLVAAAGLRTPLSGYEDNLPVDIGDGTTDLLFRLLYQYEQGPVYFSQQLGFDLRGGDAPNGLPLHTELGVSAQRVTGTLFYTRYLASGGTDIGEKDGEKDVTFPSNKDETARLGAKLHGRISTQLGAFAAGFTTLSGRNSGKTAGFSAGLIWNFTTPWGQNQ